MRPRYQTAADVERENRTADYVAKRWDCVAHRFPVDNVVDCYLERHGRVVALLEVKSRTYPAADRALFLVSAAKYLAIRSAAAGFHVNAILAVRYGDDEIRWADLDRAHVADVKISGRTDRGDPADRELCVFLRTADLDTIGYDT